MSVLNWVIAILAGICGLWIAAGNWLILIRWFLTKQSASIIPFIGGILLAVCIYNTPLRSFCWAGLLVDYGFWTGTLGLPFLIREIFRNIHKKT